MHVRVPKPMHGWRAFFGEVGIIVLGVLVALALDAIADDLSWHRKVGEARQVIRYEIGHNMRLLEWHRQQAPCVDRRLDELGVVLNKAIATGRLPAVGRFGAPAGGTWPEGVWQSQISAETATHFSANELASLARVYRYIELLRDREEENSRAWMTLQSMSGPGRPVDAVTIDRLAEALAVARVSNRAHARMEDYIRLILKQSSLGLDFPEIDPRNPPVGGGNWAVCKPIGTDIPPAYGMN